MRLPWFISILIAGALEPHRAMIRIRSRTRLVALSALLLSCVDGPARGQEAPPPPGRLVEVDGRMMHVHCLGSATPTVVIDAGAGAWSIAWLYVQELVSAQTRICVYDRAGLGWSEPRTEPRTSERAARELHELLRAAGERPPFALVGHSYGGYTVRVFASLFRDQVGGVALLESAHEDQWERLPPVVSELLEASKAGVRASIDSATHGRLRPDSIRIPRDYSGDPWLEAAYRAEQLDPDHHRTYLRELEHMSESTTQVRASARLQGIPLVVLSSARGFDPYHGTPIPVEESNRVWLELQEELASLSDDILHIVTRTGGHTVQREEPELVAGPIRELVRRIRPRAR